MTARKTVVNLEQLKCDDRTAWTTNFIIHYIFKMKRVFDDSTHKAQDSKSYVRCPICHTKIRWSGNLNTHLKIVHKTHVFQCEECKLRFENWVDFKKHSKTHEKGRFNCPIEGCSASYKQDRLAKHLRTKHGIKFKCPHCEQEFESHVLLNAHLHTHVENRFKCPLCTATFKSADYISDHIRKEHPESKTVECDRCDAKFNCQSEMAAHKISHYPADFSCPVCKKTFECASAYDAHYQPNHADINEKIAFSRNPANRWLYKLYFIYSLRENNFKVGITSRPLQHRLNRYVTDDGYVHELVEMWELPHDVNLHWCYAHQIENCIHLSISKNGFILEEGKREFFQFRNPSVDIQTVTNIITEQLFRTTFTEPLRVDFLQKSSNKLYLFYCKKYNIGKVGYTTMTINERLHSMNTGKHTTASGGNFETISVIFVDHNATIHELKAWENDIIIRFDRKFGLVKDEYFNCTLEDLETAKIIFYCK
jgi:transcription elongation factor Elf1